MVFPLAAVEPLTTDRRTAPDLATIQALRAGVTKGSDSRRSRAGVVTTQVHDVGITVRGRPSRLRGHHGGVLGARVVDVVAPRPRHAVVVAVGHGRAAAVAAVVRKL